MEEGFISAPDNQQSESFSENDDLVSVPFNHHTKDYVHNIVKSSKFFRKPYIYVTGSSKAVVLSDSLLSHLWTHEEIKLL